MSSAPFDGVQGFYEHASSQCDGPMRFSVFQPAAAKHAKLPVLYYLAGLTCNEETFMIKAGAQRTAAQLDLILVSCDTSPRAFRTAGDDTDWDFGQGAGFYLDATAAPWSQAFRMRSYVTRAARPDRTTLPCAPWTGVADAKNDALALRPLYLHIRQQAVQKIGKCSLEFSGAMEQLRNRIRYTRREPPCDCWRSIETRSWRPMNLALSI